MASIVVTIKLFAAFQDAYGVEEIRREFPEPLPVRAILDRCLQERPELEPWRDLTRFGIDLEFVEGDAIVRDGHEVVFIPPVSGG